MKNGNLIFILLVIAVVVVLANQNKKPVPSPDGSIPIKSGSAPFEPQKLKSITQNSIPENDIPEVPEYAESQKSTENDYSSGNSSNGGDGSGDSDSNYYQPPAAIVPEKVIVPLPYFQRPVKQKVPGGMRNIIAATQANSVSKAVLPSITRSASATKPLALQKAKANVMVKNNSRFAGIS